VKVLIVVHHFTPHLTGVGNVAEQQAKHLAKNGHEVQVVTSHCSGKAGISKKDGYTIHRIKASNVLENRMGAPFPIFSPVLLYRMYKLAKQADLIHVHDSFYMSSFVAAVYARLLKKPLFLTQHISMIPHPKRLVMVGQRIIYKTTGAFILRNSSKVIVYNERVRDFLVGQGVAAEKIVNMHNGVDFELFHPPTAKRKIALRQKYNLPAEQTLALFVGRFVPKKGFRKLLHAVSEDYTIVFVGGNKPDSIKSNKQAIFLGSLSQKETAEIYRACDVFVLPSEGEGFPLSIQEAMASGLPIITTDDHGYRAYNFDRELFYLISPTVREIESHLAKVASDSHLRDAMGKYSYTYAKQYFNWDKTIERISHTYQEALS
jgi:glycosyltransferase involved in cell wall biosynthesis